ncbi:hypothetical protein CBR_g4062 [Chara braunii]|uniref:Nuclear cap-binding protein subunit 2 n=1 Tax=Chara braunii TaxID=69332 RepID=A0A388KH51_CHABU|nr:hypothetical protein CBR_g4062 [Chara braunii]|eukprot:GBG69369.1 hypothetical protein CBR_g4062 [Chara braunii]
MQGAWISKWLCRKAVDNLSPYRDRRFEGTQEEFEVALRTSTTVYVGNLSFYTTEEQIYEVFSRTGEIKRIIMGLDKNTKTPCGFCFVIYYTREDTEDCVKYISGTILDDRPIRVDFDWGFVEGRQFGRGRSGGQVRDEYRTDYDPGRGGFGKLVQLELTARQQMIGDYGQQAPLLSLYPVAVPHAQYTGRKRSREDYPSEGSSKRPRGDDNRMGRNPRFRERGDSDDEDSMRH